MTDRLGEKGQLELLLRDDGRESECNEVPNFILFYGFNFSEIFLENDKLEKPSMPSSGDNKARFIGDLEVETGPRGDEV